ncbi:hypothetical protein DPMN_022113 [Dreissena polymorpha]|uniref:Uncharacterized protein n=1 Tax=Dreissena polymorpha TaxID=45954 RepID=A0A9D4SC97_DREPO|nr:hypothetical protein DPMN_022113 [Dreissena polymorpha]
MLTQLRLSQTNKLDEPISWTILCQTIGLACVRQIRLACVRHKSKTSLCQTIRLACVRQTSKTSLLGLACVSQTRYSLCQTIGLACVRQTIWTSLCQTNKLD